LTPDKEPESSRSVSGEWFEPYLLP
jgi:hypothetical protein